MVMSIKPWITLTKMAKEDYEEINIQSLILYLTSASFLSHKGGLSAREKPPKWIQAVVSKAARRRVTCHVSSHLHWRESSGKLTQNGSLNVPVSSYHTEHCWVLTSPFSKGRSLTGSDCSTWLAGPAQKGGKQFHALSGRLRGESKKIATGTRTSLNKRFNEQNNGCARALKFFVNFSASSDVISKTSIKRICEKKKPKMFVISRDD